MNQAFSFRAGAAAVPLIVVFAAGPGAAFAAPGGAAARLAPAAAVPGAFAWGDNSAGELGNGTLTGSTAPTAVSGLSGVRAVSAAGRHELALLSSGTVLAWGDDTFGQLGNGIISANGSSEVPAPVPGLSNVTAVAAGEEHSLALLANGTVMAWGDNHEGQLGNGSTSTSGVPVPVKGLSGVTAIAAGALHALAVLSNGTAMAWGQNESGQLGIGRHVSLQETPAAVAKITGVTTIAAGEEHSLALLSDGSVWVWGGNGEFQLARP